MPNDVFTSSQYASATIGTSWLATTSHQYRNDDWMKWWSDDGLQEWLNKAKDPETNTHPWSIWPLKIKGQQIGTCSGLVDIAVDSGMYFSVSGHKLEMAKYNM